MDTIPTWFTGVKLNFAENMLYHPDSKNPSNHSTVGKEDDKIAVTEVREGCSEVRNVSWSELRQRVGRLANAMRAHGVRQGDRCAVIASNSVDTLTVFYAVTSLGGLFSSSSTDMGTKGVLDRLLQIKPKYVFVDDWAVYNGKTVNLSQKIEEIEVGMRGVTEFQGLISLPRFQDKPLHVSSIAKTVPLARYLEKANGNSDLTFTRMDFRDPFLIVYSSGTTGVPKCIVHSVGGVLLNAQKEGKLHRNQGPDSVLLQYTTVCHVERS